MTQDELVALLIDRAMPDEEVHVDLPEGRYRIVDVGRRYRAERLVLILEREWG